MDCYALLIFLCRTCWLIRSHITTWGIISIRNKALQIFQRPISHAVILLITRAKLLSNVIHGLKFIHFFLLFRTATGNVFVMSQWWRIFLRTTWIQPQFLHSDTSRVEHALWLETGDLSPSLSSSCQSDNGARGRGGGGVRGRVKTGNRRFSCLLSLFSCGNLRVE